MAGFLTYGQRLPIFDRRRFRRRVILGACGLVVASAGIVWTLWGETAYFKLLVFYWQYRCSTHQVSPERVVFEEEPGFFAALQAAPELDNFRIYDAAVGGSSKRFSHSRGRLQKMVPLVDGLKAMPRTSEVFMHRRSPRNGGSFLVILDVYGSAVPVPTSASRGRELVL